MKPLPEPEVDLSEARLVVAPLLDALGVGLGVVAQNGRLVLGNEALRRFLNCAGEELHRVHRKLLARHGEGGAPTESYDLLTDSGRLRCVENRYVRGDGSAMWGRLAMAIVPGQDSRPRVAVIVCQDVTQRRDLEQKLRSVALLVADWVPPRDRDTPGQHMAAKLAGLSRREAQIVRLLAANRRVPSIARTLGVTPRTVRNHLASAYRKLGVHSQAALLDVLNADDVRPPETERP